MENNLPAELKAMLDEKYPISEIEANNIHSQNIAKRKTFTEAYLLGQSSMKRVTPTNEQIESMAPNSIDEIGADGESPEHVYNDGWITGMKHYRDTYATPSGQCDNKGEGREIKFKGVWKTQYMAEHLYSLIAKNKGSVREVEICLNAWLEDTFEASTASGECNNKEIGRLRDLLEDVVNELDLSNEIIEKHGPLGTVPAELVRLVLEQKNLEIRALSAGMDKIEYPATPSLKVEGNEVDWEAVDGDLTYWATQWKKEHGNFPDFSQSFTWLRTNLHKYLKK